MQWDMPLPSFLEPVGPSGPLLVSCCDIGNELIIDASLSVIRNSQFIISNEQKTTKHYTVLMGCLV